MSTPLPPFYSTQNLLAGNPDCNKRFLYSSALDRLMMTFIPSASGWSDFDAIVLKYLESAADLADFGRRVDEVSRRGRFYIDDKNLNGLHYFRTMRGEDYVPIAVEWVKKVSIGNKGGFLDLDKITTEEFVELTTREGGKNRNLMGFPTLYCQHLPGSINVWPVPDAAYDVVCV